MACWASKNLKKQAIGKVIGYETITLNGLCMAIGVNGVEIVCGRERVGGSTGLPKTNHSTSRLLDV